MNNAFVDSLTMIDSSGRLIIALIVLLLMASIGSTGMIRWRYYRLETELRTHADPTEPFASRALNQIVLDARDALGRNTEQFNAQVIVEHRFQTELRATLVGERFVKASVSLAVILGLVGTFYGLTSAIGKLVSLVSADSPGTADVTQSITEGLSQALTGMSVAFSTSLFGIAAAIVLTLTGVFFNVADRRTRAMVAVEAYLDNVLVLARAATDSRGDGAARGLGQLVDSFGQSVATLQGVVVEFDSALQRFATNTRDFQEVNLHLKDNIQRMSLAFGDLSDTLRTQAGAPKRHD